MLKNKKFVWGQYFTRRDAVEKFLNLLKYDRNIRVLEPSSGTGNFLRGLEGRNFKNVVSCEIDLSLSERSSDFFLYPVEEKFSLIIGNPPFTKFNIKESYYYTKKYERGKIPPDAYLGSLSKKLKMRIENAFILKSIKHLKDGDSAIAFVLPISFFIAKKNAEVKKEIAKNFSTIVIYQDDRTWFDDNIPCCFAIFSNIPKYRDKIILLYEKEKTFRKVLGKESLMTEELIPKSFFYRMNNRREGTALSDFLLEKSPGYKRSYRKNNVSGANILERQKIPEGKNVSDYCLAVARVGNASVGKAGLISREEDILNEMFFVFEFRDECNGSRETKEKICELISENQQHFRNSTVRVGSKSIKRRDVLDFRIDDREVAVSSGYS